MNLIRRMLAASVGLALASAMGESDALALQRLPNSTLQLPSSPPVYGYTRTHAFGSLTFTNPVAIASPPGETNRLFVVEQRGRIVVITNLASPNPTPFLNLFNRINGGVPTNERGLLGLAFHPGYATNRYFYVFYTGTATTPVPGGTNALHDILARFQTSAADPNQADPDSELRLIVQYDQQDNHNGGDLHFGADGYLYVALGDEGGANDTWNNSQTITKDFFSGILRIDVDMRPGSLPPNPHPAATPNYAVPPDNPFVGATSFNGLPVNPASVRTEFWAVGLRNPWRFSFDRETGRLYCADVGQNTWEEIDIITKGGNYGWAYREGFVAGPKTPPPGFTAIDPILAYAHGSATNQGFSVTGGVVYRGSRLSQLTGAYVFADYVSGNIWSLRYDGNTVTEWQRLTGETGLAAFGLDPSNGDILMANQNLDTIRRLVYSSTATGTPLPPTLADTGAFSDPVTLTPQAGIVPYELNVPFWSDHARKTRWFSVPNTNLTIGFKPEGNWAFPTGSVWIKHFELELTNGVPSSRRRLETRFLVKNAAGAYGITYRWSDSSTNALLVPEEGMDETFVVDAGGGLLRTQVWHYPSRQECLICHTPQGGYALGFNTAQLNRDFDYGSGPTNQILALSAAGYFQAPVEAVNTLRRLAHPTNQAASLEFRVRSYLEANCVYCHQPTGTPQSLWDARINTPTALAGLINGPLVDTGPDPNNRVIKPGFMANSMMLTRIATLGPGRMPPLASSELDAEAIQLLRDWITNDLPSYQTYQNWQVAFFGTTNAPNSGPGDNPDSDPAVNELEYLTGTHPLQSASYWDFAVARAGNSAAITFPQVANRAFLVEWAPQLPSAAWTPLDVPGNAPFFPATNRPGLVMDALTNSNRFYRVRVSAP